jgi:MYXO-CTERM domain-containing protein
MLPGEHKVDVRARYAGDYQTLDPTPAELEVLIDPTPPGVAASYDDTGIEIVVTDRESPADTLGLSGRLDDGEWFEIDAEVIDGRAIGRFSLDDVGDATTLSLRAVDSVGNVSDVTAVRVGYNPERETTQAGCACHDAGTPHGHSEALLALVLLAGLLTFRLRRTK